MTSHVLIIGGDSRNKEIIHHLLHDGYIISLLGYEQLHMQDEKLSYVNKKDVDFSQIDAIILPVHGTSHTGEITSTYSSDIFSITSAMIEETPKHCTIYTGVANEFLREVAQNRPLEIIFKRDDIAIYNSISTAEATLQIAMEETDYTIHGTKIAVLGFGRVGMTMGRLFHNVGAQTTVFARKSSDIARITELGMQAAYIKDVKKKIHPFSICINTIPHKMLDKTVLQAMTKETLIIDVASAPGGTDFVYAKERGIQTIHALGLPGKTAPKSAGNILANTISSLMKEKGYK